MLTVGVVKSSGILFVAFQERFQSTSATTSLLSTVQNFTYSIVATLVMLLGVKLASCRTLVAIGALVNSAAFVISSLVGNISLLMFSYGILNGVGNSFSIATSLTMVSLYFNKRRGLANSLAICGGSVGGLVFAPLQTAMLEHLGYNGCLLIMAALLLNGCVSAALFRPTTFYTSRSRRGGVSGGDSKEARVLIASDESHTGDNAMAALENVKNETRGDRIEHLGLQPKRTTGPSICRTADQQSEIHQNFSENTVVGMNGQSSLIQEYFYRERSYSDSGKENFRKQHDDIGPRNIDVVSSNDTHTNKSSSRSFDLGTSNNMIHSLNNLVTSFNSSSASIFANADYISGSALNISNGPLHIQSIHELNVSPENKSPNASRCLAFLKTLTIMFDVKTIKMPICIAFQLSAMLQCPSSMLSSIYIAPYAKENGLDTRDVALLVTVFNSVDLVARIATAFISDSKFARRSTMVAVAAMVIALASHILRWFSSFSALMAFAVLLGLVNGVYFSLYAVIIVDYMSIERLKSVLGINALVHGSSVALTFYLVGLLRDFTGSYVYSYHLLGTMSLLGGVIMYCLQFIGENQGAMDTETVAKKPS
ncbi:monocarboxylate transporter 2-like isoform X2 [Dreissena polymorpha]|nr:monocarboxylate transporter 2-like isoform X2 [Dreissena polymorpha]